ncbi:hypothetical protein BD309DRAFT_951792 [Dichomitus squalens]|nr:hypothetical protein BD309DRAFT_951792 [Dichomitus squalens]
MHGRVTLVRRRSTGPQRRAVVRTSGHASSPDQELNGRAGAKRATCQALGRPYTSRIPRGRRR